jgi:hypothetical protein
MDGVELAHAVHERWPPTKIIVVLGALKLPDVGVPADSRFFGKPLEAKKIIAETQNMIGHAGTGSIPCHFSPNHAVPPDYVRKDMSGTRHKVIVMVYAQF